MNIKLAALVCAGAVFLSGLSFAQAPVVDRTTVGDSNSGSGQTSAARNNYLEIQALINEVSVLRGMIEELSYEVRKVQQRQDTDYQDLDRRIASGTAGGSTSANSGFAGSSTASEGAGVAVSLPAVASNDADQPAVDQLYQDGFNALREGNRQQAVVLFEDLIGKYPGSSREADSLFWLGETHWLNLEIEKSRQSLTRLLDGYPAYRKAADAQYRLGLIYDQLGDTNKAIEYMKLVAVGTNTQASSARSYLEKQGAL